MGSAQSSTSKIFQKVRITSEENTTETTDYSDPLPTYRTRIKLKVSIPEDKIQEESKTSEPTSSDKPKVVTKKVYQRVGKRFTIKLNDDPRDCTISGSGFLPNGNLVLTDFDNRRLKLFDENLKNLSHLDLKVNPQNMSTRTQDFEVYITFNDSFQNGILVVSIKGDNSMLVTSTINMKGLVYGISSNNGGLAVMVNNPSGWQIHLITLTGSLKAKVIPESDGKSIFVRPDYLKVTKESKLLVSDRGNNSVYCFNARGKILFQNSRLRQPMGIALDNADSGIHIFVASPGMIHQLSTSGDRIGALMSQDEIGFPPICLCYDEDDSLLVVAGQSNYMMAYRLTDYKIQK